MATMANEHATRTGLANRNPVSGDRDLANDNAFGLGGIDHFALPTRDIRLMERFVREFLGGVPYYYAGLDEVDRNMGRKVHLFVRIGRTLLQCTEEDGPANPVASDNSIAPHWAFRTDVEGLDRNIERLKEAGIPFFGPACHRDIDVVSVYFRSPEGHKMEFCTWEKYPEERSRMIGSPGVGLINWESLMHQWPNNPR